MSGEVRCWVRNVVRRSRARVRAARSVEGGGRVSEGSSSLRDVGLEEGSSCRGLG